MLVKCANCGHDNQLGAIFCRNCGDKLNIEEMRPEVKDKRGIKINFLKLFKTLIQLAIFVIIIGGALCLFVSSGLPVAPELTKAETVTAEKKGTSLVERVSGKEGTRDKNSFILTPNEASYIFNKKILDSSDADNKGGYSIGGIFFTVSEDKKVTIVLNAMLAAKLETRFELVGKINNKADGVTFEIENARMGYIPFPESVRGVVTGKFKPLLVKNGKDILSQLNSQLKSIQINDKGNFVIHLNHPKKDK
jgi:hypothetical protein